MQIKQEHTDIMRDAIAYYGHLSQMLVAIEEMSEITKELLHYIRDRNERENVCEEIADAIIMLCQMRIIFGEEDVDSMIAKKIERLKKRMES